MKSIAGKFLLVLNSFLFAQLNFTGSYVSSFGDSQNDFNYFDNRININGNWNNWNAWIEFEHSNPPELGLKKIGLRKLRIDYSGDNYTIKLGDLYEFWGNGLVLNMVDDQSIDLDTGVRGGLFSYFKDKYAIETIVGNQKTWRSTNQAPAFDERIPNYQINNNVYAAKFSSNMNSLINEFYFMKIEDNHYLPITRKTNLVNHQLYGFNSIYSSDVFDINLEYVLSADEDRAFYLNSNYYLDEISIGISYKNYLFDRLSPYSRWDFVNNPNGALFIQQMPTVFRSHSSLYLGRITHQIDYNDEVGFSLAFEQMLKNNGSFIFYFSQASRHDEWASIRRDSLSIYEWTITNSTSLMPSTEWMYNPFKEYYFELSGYLDSKLFYQIAYGNNQDVTDIFSSQYSEQGHSYSYEMIQASTMPIMISYQINEKNSINVQIEYQKIKKGMYSLNSALSSKGEIFGSSFEKNHQINRFISIGYSQSPKWSLSINIDNANTDDVFAIQKGRNTNFIESALNQFFNKSLTWASIDLVYNTFNSTQLSISYGSQRGGVYCSNGICKYVQPFENGFKFGITTAF